MARVLVVDPADPGRDGWHEVFGSSSDALNGNVSRVFLTGVPQTVPTSKCRQPDDWSCGPHSLAECLGQANGEEARNWLLARGLIDSDSGTQYSGIVRYLEAKGYSCKYDGQKHDGEMNTAIFQKIINHLYAGYKVILCMHGTRKGCRTNYWTKDGHYICVYAIEENGIQADGLWGIQTTKLAQKVFGTVVDGVVSNQNEQMKQYLPNCMRASWNFVRPDKLKKGSALIRAIQKKIGAATDGFCGNETIVKLQKFLGVKQDGYCGGVTVTAFQNWLNRQV